MNIVSNVVNKYARPMTIFIGACITGYVIKKAIECCSALTQPRALLATTGPTIFDDKDITKLIPPQLGFNYASYPRYDVIHLVGEHHNNPMCIAIQDCLVTKAADENIILASEGLMFDDQYGDNEFGIEDEFVVHLCAVFEFYKNLTLYKTIQDLRLLNKHECLTQIKETIDDLSNLESWSSGFGSELRLIVLALSSLDSSQKKIVCANNIEVFSAIKNLAESPKFFTKSNQFEENNSLETPFFLGLHNNIIQWINLFEDVINLYIKAALNRHMEVAKDIKDKGPVRVEKIRACLAMDDDTKRNELAAIKDTFLKFQKLALKIMLTERNHIFLKNIISIFENNKSSKKPFYAVIGSAHVPFLHEKLKENGYNVELNILSKNERYLSQLVENWKGTRFGNLIFRF